MKHIKLYNEDVTIKQDIDCIPQCPWIKPFKFFEIKHPRSVGCFRGAKQRHRTFKEAISGMKKYLEEKIVPLVDKV